MVLNHNQEICRKDIVGLNDFKLKTLWLENIESSIQSFVSFLFSFFFSYVSVWYVHVIILGWRVQKRMLDPLELV